MKVNAHRSNSCPFLCHLKWRSLMFHNDDIKSQCTWPTEKEAISDIRDTVFMVSSGDTFSAGQVRECQSSFLSPDASLASNADTAHSIAPSSAVSGHLASHCPRLSYLGPHSTRKIVSWQQNSSEHCLWFPRKIRSRLNFLIPLKWLAEPGLSSQHRPYHAPTIKHTGGCHQNAFIREERLAAVFSISPFSYW